MDGCPSKPPAVPEVSASLASATSAVASRFHGTDISQDPIGGESTSTYRNGCSVVMGAVSQTATHLVEDLKTLLNQQS
uniref:hypothetical protein n=1 Tax=Eikenella sp. NML97-A-109 TaxID=1795833 RepID=UPI0018D42421|nr:hypothetical protein [Eikenella sp. NML97-A-109]